MLLKPRFCSLAPAQPPATSTQAAGNVGLGSRVEISFQGQLFAGTVIALPADDEDGRGRWTVQCDADQQGVCTYASSVSPILLSSGEQVGSAFDTVQAPSAVDSSRCITCSVCKKLSAEGSEGCAHCCQMELHPAAPLPSIAGVKAPEPCKSSLFLLPQSFQLVASEASMVPGMSDLADVKVLESYTSTSSLPPLSFQPVASAASMVPGTRDLIDGRSWEPFISTSSLPPFAFRPVASAVSIVPGTRDLAQDVPRVCGTAMLRPPPSAKFLDSGQMLDLVMQSHPNLARGSLASDQPPFYPQTRLDLSECLLRENICVPATRVELSKQPGSIAKEAPLVDPSLPSVSSQYFSPASSGSSSQADSVAVDNQLIEQIEDLGFTREQAMAALKRTSSVEAAVEWIIQNGM